MPNIKGSFSDITYQVITPPYTDGCFKNADRKEVYYYGGVAAEGFDGILFDASKSNFIYGSSTTVQPPAIVLIPQIKF